jgi:hypothetical protein
MSSRVCSGKSRTRKSRTRPLVYDLRIDSSPMLVVPTQLRALETGMQRTTGIGSSVAGRRLVLWSLPKPTTSRAGLIAIGRSAKATDGLAKSAGTTTTKGASSATETSVVHLAPGVSVHMHIGLVTEAVLQPSSPASRACTTVAQCIVAFCVTRMIGLLIAAVQCPERITTARRCIVALCVFDVHHHVSKMTPYCRCGQARQIF